MGVKKFISKPVEIEAVWFDGANGKEIVDWINADSPESVGKAFAQGDRLYIPTLEGTMIASLFDWIVKGTRGEFYPCKPDVFETKYAESNG